MDIKVGVSNRHVHLCAHDFNTLFKDTPMKIDRLLSQPEEFASDLKVTIRSPKDEIKNVRIMGPLREYTQVEISKTDAYKLGINPPIRKSGDLIDSEKITIVGPYGSIEVKGCIIAERHFHISTAEFERLGYKETDEFMLLVDSEKGGELYNLYPRLEENTVTEAHLDTDEANAFLIHNGDTAKLIKKS